MRCFLYSATKNLLYHEFLYTNVQAILVYKQATESQHALVKILFHSSHDVM